MTLHASYATAVSADLPPEDPNRPRVFAMRASLNHGMSGNGSQKDCPDPAIEQYSEEDDDDSWQDVLPEKPRGPQAVLYIGNLKRDVEGESLTRFIAARADRFQKKVKVFKYTIFPKETRAAARIFVNESAKDLFCTKGFLPRPLYARPWDFNLYANDANDSGKKSQPSETHETNSVAPNPSASQGSSHTPAGPKSQGKRQRSTPTLDGEMNPKRPRSSRQDGNYDGDTQGERSSTPVTSSEES